PYMAILNVTVICIGDEWPKATAVSIEAGCTGPPVTSAYIRKAEPKACAETPASLTVTPLAVYEKVAIGVGTVLPAGIMCTVPTCSEGLELPVTRRTAERGGI